MSVTDITNGGQVLRIAEVAEPATLALLALVLVLAGGVHRRRRA